MMLLRAVARGDLAGLKRLAATLNSVNSSAKAAWRTRGVSTSQTAPVKAIAQKP